MNSTERDARVLGICLSAFSEIDRVAGEPNRWEDLESAISSRRAKCHEVGKHSYFWTLPVVTCMAVGGTTEQAIPLAAAWILYDMASDILDDIYDQDKPYEPWMKWEPERATLVSIGALFLAQQLVNNLVCDATTKVEIQQLMATSGLIAARGQTISIKPTSVKQYFERIGSNTAQVLGSIAQAGGQLATKDETVLLNLYEYGVALGTLLQIMDDCTDMMSADHAGDLARGLLTLPVLLAISKCGNIPCEEVMNNVESIALKYTDAKKARLYDLFRQMEVRPTILAIAKVYEQKALDALRDFTRPETDYLRFYATQAFRSFSS